LCQKRTCNFWHRIKSFSNAKYAFKTFGQVPKKNLQLLAQDQKFKKDKNTITTIFDLVPKVASSFLAQDQKFLN